MKKISQGAEAIIYQDKNKIIKNRTPKSYRHPLLDDKLRKLRTRSEAKILDKVNTILPSPKVLNIDENKKIITLEEIKGKRLSQYFEKTKSQEAISKQIAHSLNLLHNNDLIHGDLTTSNLIWNEKEKKVYFIDFGLGFHSPKVEDKAVDLHVLKEALEAKHPSIYEKVWSTILKNYSNAQVLKQLEKVEKRGRYKSQY